MATRLEIQKPKCYRGVAARFVSDDGIEFVVVAPGVESLKTLVAGEFKNPVAFNPLICGQATLIDEGGVKP